MFFERFRDPSAILEIFPTLVIDLSALFGEFNDPIDKARSHDDDTVEVCDDNVERVDRGRSKLVVIRGRVVWWNFQRNLDPRRTCEGRLSKRGMTSREDLRVMKLRNTLSRGRTTRSVHSQAVATLAARRDRGTVPRS